MTTGPRTPASTGRTASARATLRGAAWSRVRIGVIVMAAVAILLVLVSVTQIRASLRATRIAADAELSEAQLAGSAVSIAISADVSQLEQMAESGAFQSFLTPRGGSSTSSLFVGQTAPTFTAFALIGGDGTVRYSHGPLGAVGADVSDQAYFTVPRRTRSAYVSTALEQSAGTEVVALAVPVLTEETGGAVLGVAVGTVSGAELGRTIGTRLHDGSDLVIVDRAGHALTGPAADATHSYKTDPAVAGALRGRSGTGVSGVPGLRGSQLVGYAPVESLHWGVIVAAPASLVVRPTGGRLFLIFGLVALLILDIWFVVRNLLAHLARQRDRAAAVFTSVGEGIAALDENGRIQAVNPALEQLLERDATDLIGKRWAEEITVFDADGRAIAFDDTLVAKALREQVVASTAGYTESIETAGGERVAVAVTAAPLTTGDQREGAVAIVRDVSHEQEVDRLKSTLISTVSHELRTPLTMIQGFSELLLTRSDIDAAHVLWGALEQVHTSSERLTRLVDDLLSVSRIDAGKLDPELVTLNLGDVVGEALAPFVSHGGRNFVIEVDGDIGPIRADHDMTVGLITNLVSNAVKYSGSGSTVRVTGRRAGATAEVSVADEGIGMSGDEVATVFEKFARADRREVRRVGGAGLGLYIVRQFAEAQGGRIWVTSTIGQGSVFTFSVPLAEP